MIDMTETEFDDVEDLDDDSAEDMLPAELLAADGATLSSDDTMRRLCEYLGVNLDGPDLGKLARKLEAAPPPQSPAEATEELREWVVQYRNATRGRVRITHMVIPKKAEEERSIGGLLYKKGDMIPPPIRDAYAQKVFVAMGVLLDQRRAAMSRHMGKLLEFVPIHSALLERVPGIGPSIASVLAAKIIIDRAPKVSNLIRWCGNACIEGVAERPKVGDLGIHYCPALRTALYMWFTSMFKGAYIGTGTTNKYLRRYREVRHGIETGGRIEAGKILHHNGKMVSAKGFAHNKARRKAVDLLIEDIYTIWRTLEGLPVWPSYHAMKLGYSHGGKVCVNEPRLLTMDEAWAAVGEVGSVPLTGAEREAREVAKAAKRPKVVVTDGQIVKGAGRRKVVAA